MNESSHYCMLKKISDKKNALKGAEHFESFKMMFIGNKS